MQQPFMEKLAAWIVDKRKLIMLVFIALAIFSAFSRNWVSVNDSLTDYLPDTTETRQGLDLMDQEFTTFATAEIMVEHITYERALSISEQIEQIEGVKSVDFDDTQDHYKEASALFDVTFDGLNDDDISINALAETEKLLSEYDVYTNTEVGNPLKAIIDKEMLIVDGIAVLIVISVLLLTSRSYGEIPVLLLTFGSAALLNMGTNFLMGEISFVTDSIAIVLQLALALDYAIILCHRFSDEHKTKAPREAAIAALSKAIPEISASSLTTISGLLALTFMEYELGFDLGAVLIKAIFLSLVSVFMLMPGLLVMFSPIIDKTPHKSKLPDVSSLGNFSWATRYIIPAIFAVVIVAASILSGRANYVYSQYSVESIRKNDTQRAKIKIEDMFGSTQQFAILIPTGEYEKEKKIITELEQLPQTDEVIGLANQEAKDGCMLTDALTPREFSELLDIDYEVARALYTGYAYADEDYAKIVASPDTYAVPLIDIFTYLCDKKDEADLNLPSDTEEDLNDLEEQLEDAKLQLRSDTWSRIVVNSDIEEEGDESFEYLTVIKGIVGKHYSGDYYVVGNTTSCRDLETSFVKDNKLIGILSIAFVILVLIFTFKTIGLSVLLILIIQGSIWCNFTVPVIMGNNVFFLTYLIISSIQMGANIDYAIVISSHYLELKKKLPIREAMKKTINEAFPTIFTSGTMLASAGVIIGIVATNETVSAIGVYLCVGTLISIMLVIFVLPQILLFGDFIISKTTFKLSLSSQDRTQKVGTVQLDGKVRGNLNGYFVGEVHGTFKGEVDAVIEMINVSHEEQQPEPVIAPPIQEDLPMQEIPEPQQTETAERTVYKRKRYEDADWDALLLDDEGEEDKI